MFSGLGIIIDKIFGSKHLIANKLRPVSVVPVGWWGILFLSYFLPPVRLFVFITMTQDTCSSVIPLVIYFDSSQPNKEFRVWAWISLKTVQYFHVKGSICMMVVNCVTKHNNFFFFQKLLLLKWIVVISTLRLPCFFN